MPTRCLTGEEESCFEVCPVSLARLNEFGGLSKKIAIDEVAETSAKLQLMLTQMERVGSSYVL